MRRWNVYGIVMVLILLLAPIPKTDVGALAPVELLYLREQDGSLRVETDTGDVGIGQDLNSALADLRATAAGVVFLDTTDYVIVTPGTISLLPALEELLRPTTEVCVGMGADAQAAAFLRTHKPGVTLNDIRSGARVLPVLTRTEERYRLEF